MSLRRAIAHTLRCLWTGSLDSVMVAVGGLMPATAPIWPLATTTRAAMRAATLARPCRRANKQNRVHGIHWEWPSWVAVGA